MKKYEVYRNIRKRAIIMGLPISLFALMMVSIIGSLLIIIFSFSLAIILSVSVFNITLYGALTYMTRRPHLVQVQKTFPKTISNKRLSSIYYE
ncbi:hypothetical protein K1F50_18640 [Muricauda oceani]|uniref:DUF4133 domain-containing protein n=1 Tax=Flagellimonas oceani TaxID=2698672 RepID=A0A6G7IZ82_9FLAO|nr:hypothetical protein [Allomuricauda oceani]MBW8244833.1 hypothetical protein [Allomuricauda oceani]QII43856.1 hypothetical protein GVT53_03920 [Allomuricauda oceani]